MIDVIIIISYEQYYYYSPYIGAKMGPKYIYYVLLLFFKLTRCRGDNWTQSQRVFLLLPLTSFQRDVPLFTCWDLRQPNTHFV